MAQLHQHSHLCLGLQPLLLVRLVDLDLLQYVLLAGVALQGHQVGAAVGAHADSLHDTISVHVGDMNAIARQGNAGVARGKVGRSACVELRERFLQRHGNC